MRNFGITGERGSCSSAVRHLNDCKVNKSIRFPEHLKKHFDECESCWRRLVEVRWNLSKDSLDLNELKEFLGNSYISGCDSSWLLANEWNNEVKSSSVQDELFYENTPWYIYNLVIWKASGQRPNYVAKTSKILLDLNVKTILDFGAGVGNDSLDLSYLGFEVSFIEINKSCANFLEWRTKKRGLKLNRIDSYSDFSCSFDALWAMDVVEHLRDPIDVLSPILGNASVFIYDCEHNQTSNGRHPFHFQHSEEALHKAWSNLGFSKLESEENINIYIRK